MDLRAGNQTSDHGTLMTAEAGGADPNLTVSDLLINGSRIQYASQIMSPSKSRCSATPSPASNRCYA